MGGGGSSSNKNIYQKDRKGVATRSYGVLSSNGIQSQEEYDAILKGQGVATAARYGTKSLASTGVDYDAAINDWNNYQLERQEIAEYDAKQTRAQEAPDDLTGTTGNVDYSLAIDDSKTGAVAGEGEDTTSDKKKAVKDVNVNASSQSLGISTDG